MKAQVAFAKCAFGYAMSELSQHFPQVLFTYVGGEAYTSYLSKTLTVYISWSTINTLVLNLLRRRLVCLADCNLILTTDITAVVVGLCLHSVKENPLFSRNKAYSSLNLVAHEVLFCGRIWGLLSLWLLFVNGLPITSIEQMNFYVSGNCSHDNLWKKIF